jgi:putative effector of murein hydrolase LrgA (UPF0299 family)
MLAVGVAASGLLQLGVVYLPVGQKLFDTIAIPAAGWPVILAVAVLSFAMVNATNAWVSRRRARSTQ